MTHPTKLVRGGRALSGRLWALVPFLVAAALTVGFARLPQGGMGTVVGDVSNGTPGGSVPADLTLTLHTFSEMAETGVYTTTLADTTQFRFEDVTLTTGESAIVRTVYRDVMYVSEFRTIEDGATELDMPVTIYETTNSPENVSVAQLHFFVNKLDGQVQIGEFAVVANTGDRTYVGSEDQVGGTTWSVTLPEGASDLRFDGAELGGRFVPTQNGFADTRPVPPGEASVETSFTYELPFEEGLGIEQTINLPVRAAVLVLPEGAWSLVGEQLGSEGVLDTQMGAALSYTAGPLAAGEPLSFNIVRREEVEEGLVGNGGQAGQVSSGRGLTWGIGALLAAAVAVAVMWTSGSSESVPAEVEDQVREIARLDRAHERGELSEQAYEDGRRALKQKIRAILSD